MENERTRYAAGQCFNDRGIGMKKITIDITDAKSTRVDDAIAGLFPIPSIVDPGWKAKEGEEPPMIPEYTKEEWKVENVKRYLIRQLARYEQMIETKKIKYKEEKDLDK